MYTKEEREGILWEFHRSGMSVPEACRLLPLFPTRNNLYRWLRMEDAGELAAAEMPRRAERMRCSHGEGGPRLRRAAPPRRAGGGRDGGRARADRLARLGRRPAGRACGAREDGRGQAGGGTGGVGRPKSTRPGLFDQRGEVAGRGAGAGEAPAREAQGRDRDALDTQEHLPRPGR